MPRVSLCMIVKDEEANLPQCLESAAGLFQEVIVVDTGSADHTRGLALGFGGRVFDFPWVDSFAAARNECLRHATGDWIFWLDADDRLDGKNREHLRALLAGLGNDNAGYVMHCLCLPDPVNNSATKVHHLRLFRNDRRIRWSYRVHEQVLPALRTLGTDIRWTDITVLHTGYQDTAIRQRKLQRDLRLLELDHAERPRDPFTLFNLGQVHKEMGQLAEALLFLKRSLELSSPKDSIVRKLHALVAQTHRHLGQPTEALAACRAGRQHYPHDTEILFQEGLVLREMGKLQEAQDCFEHLLTSQDANHFESVDVGLRGHKARNNLARIYYEQGRLADAETQWRAVVDEAKNFGPARVALGDLYLRQERWQDLDGAIQGLRACPNCIAETAGLEARWRLARKEFAEARSILERLAGQLPNVLWPQVLLSHVLLQEGKDMPAAEQALRRILALDPNHAEARHNLALLRGIPSREHES